MRDRADGSSVATIVGEFALELFHRIGDADSARLRRYISEKGLLEQVRFRNVAFSEAARDFTSRGGRSLPAIWDGEALFEGAAAATARLEAFAQSRAR